MKLQGRCVGMYAATFIIKASNKLKERPFLHFLHVDHLFFNLFFVYLRAKKAERLSVFY